MAFIAVLAWAAIGVWRPGTWLFAVPALLPLLNFAPWTGWLMFDEFDLLLLATLAGGYARLAWDGWQGRPSAGSNAEPVAAAVNVEKRRVFCLIVCLAACSILGLARGLADTGFGAFDWFAAYADPLNSVRISKSWLFALALFPLMQREMDWSESMSIRRFGRGMLAGTCIVGTAVLWERTAYPGLADFSMPYRTTALFWEMHVGGAALDVYVAMAAPFVAWAVWSARSVKGWSAAALLTLLWGYVCLTTFSRGVYLAVALSLSLLAALVWVRRFRRRVRWRVAGDVVLGVALAAEVLLVAVTGSFMNERVGASDRDLSGRLAHWSDGVHLLHTPAEWAFGIGSGRLPAHYAAEVPQREFSGETKVVAAGAQSPAYVEIRGPRTLDVLGGLYGLTQRVSLVAGVRYSVELDVRARAESDVRVRVCEMHLLYARHCQRTGFHLQAGKDGWQHLNVPLAGPRLDAGHGYAPRMAVLVLSVRNAGAVIDVTNVALRAGEGRSLVRNGRFGDGLTGWFPVAQRYFLPWHIDNLYLETLIERGIVGLVALAVLGGFALRAVWRSNSAAAPFLAASVTGALLVGMVSSVMDVPRVSFLFCFIALCCTQLRFRTEARG